MILFIFPSFVPICSANHRTEKRPTITIIFDFLIF
jgi:hypothetical protein